MAEVARITALLGLPTFPPSALGGFHRGTNRAIVLDSSRTRVALRHELVHWFVANAMPDCPPALDEGLAQYVTEPENAARNRRLRTTSLALSSGALSFEALLSAKQNEIHGSGPAAVTRRDLAFCLARALCEPPTPGSPNLARVVRERRFAPGLKEAWAKTVQSYRAAAVPSRNPECAGGRSDEPAN
jgi:hypothetical protein